MAGPFDQVGNFFNQLGTNVHGLLGGAMQPPPSAKPQNKPQQAPSVTVPSSLQGMAPTGGVPVSGPKQPQGLGSLGQGLTQFGQNIQHSGFGQAVGNVANQLGAARDLAGQDLATDLGGGDAAKRMAKLATNPFGYAADVINAGIISPVQLASKPEMWFAEDHNQGSIGGAFQQGTGLATGSSGPGHNYLRDVFNPVLKAITGSEAPHTSLYYANQAKDLTDQANRLAQVRQQIDSNPNATQQDKNTWDGAHAALTQKIQQYQAESSQSADWWANSPVSKTMGILGKLPEIGVLLGTTIVAPEALSMAFGPGILQDPLAAGQSFLSQIVQGVDFAQTLSDPERRAHMTSQELAANIENVTFLASMGLGGKALAKGRAKMETDPEQLALQKVQDKLTSGTPDAQTKVVGDIQTKVPDAIHSPDSPVEHVAQVNKIADQLGPATQDHAPRIAELESHIQELMFQRSRLGTTAEDLHQKRAIMEEAAAARDEINNLKNQPKAMVRQAQQYQAGDTTPETMYPGDRITAADRAGIRAAQDRAGFVDVPKEDQVGGSGTDRMTSRGGVRPYQDQRLGDEGAAESFDAEARAYGRDKQIVNEAAADRNEQPMPERFTTPVIPENPYPDMSQATQLGKNYPDLKQDGNAFSLNAGTRAPISPYFEEDLTSLRTRLEDTGYAVVDDHALITGNGWWFPEVRWGIALPSSALDAHADFTEEARLPGDDREGRQIHDDLLSAGAIKFTGQAGGKFYSVDRVSSQNLSIIGDNMFADMKTGMRDVPYIIAETGRQKSYVISPAELVKNDYDLIENLVSMIAVQRRNPELYSGMRAPAPTLEEVKGLLNNVRQDMGEGSLKIVKGSQVRTGTWFPDGTGVDATMGGPQDLFRVLSRYGNVTPEALKEASRHWVTVDRQGSTMILHADEFGQIAMKTIEDNLNAMPARLAPERVVVETTRPYRAASSPYGPAYDFTMQEFLDNDGQLMGLKTPLAGPRTSLAAGTKEPVEDVSPGIGLADQARAQARIDKLRKSLTGSPLNKLVQYIGGRRIPIEKINRGTPNFPFEGFVFPDKTALDLNDTRNRAAGLDHHTALYDSMLDALPGKTVGEHRDIMSTWVEVRRDRFDGPIWLTFNSAKRGAVAAEDYLMNAIAKENPQTRVVIEVAASRGEPGRVVGGKGGPLHDFTLQEFKDNDFKLEGLRSGQGSRPQQYFSGARNAKSTQTTQAIADRQVGQTSKAGQAGEGYNPTQASELPSGVPEGATLTAVKQEEGQRPFAVWKVGAEPAAALRQSAWTEHLTSQIRETFGSILPYAQITKLLAERKTIDVVQRQNEIENTLLTQARKHDYFGQVKHLVFDTKFATDAEFNFETGVVTVNPYRMFQVSFLRAMKVELQDTVKNYTGLIPPQGMSRAMSWIDNISKMDQAGMDYKILAEEIFHANDIDGHTWQTYLPALWRSLPRPYWDVLSHVLAGETEGGVKFFDAYTGKDIGVSDTSGAPVTNWMRAIRYALEGKLDPGNSSTVAAMMAELRANALMVHAGVPGTDFTFRVKEAFINELTTPSLIRGHADATGQTYQGYAQAEVAPQLALKGRLAGARPQQSAAASGTEAMAGQSEATAAPGAADTRVGLPGRDSGDQTSLAASERPIGKDVDVQQLVNLGRTGYEGNWHDFAMAVVRPDLPSFENVAEYFNKLSREDQATWLQVGGVELAREEQYGPPMEAAAPPENIDSPMFQARMARIKSARAEVARSGKILDDMARVGRPQVEIDAKKAHVAAIRKYSELPATMGEKEANQIATQAGQAELEALAKLKDVKRGGVTYKEPTAPRDLQETEAIQGKRTNKIPAKFANFIAGRLNLHGYRDPENIEKFFANLWAGDKAAMKEYKQLKGLARDAIKEYTGFEGKVDISKAVGPVSRSRVQIKTDTAPYVGDTIASSGGTYVNPVDSAGLKSTVQNADVIDVRHGETGHNPQGLIRSTLDIPLNRTGIAQANRVAWAFRGQKVGIIVTSPLERAYKTAAAIAKVTGAKVVVDENMRPWDLGDKKGTSISAFVPAMKDYIHNKPDVPVEGGESFNQFKNRYLTARQSQLAKYAAKGQVVFVGHARTVRLAEDYHNAGGDASKMDYRSLDAPTEIGPGGMLALQRQGNQHVVTGKVSQGEGTMAESLDRATAPKTPVKPAIEAATSTPLEQVAQKSRVVIKRVAQAEARTQAAKGDIAPRLDIEARIDTIAVDPTHPANITALRAKVAQNQVTGGKALGIPAAKLKEFQVDYAQKLEIFAQKLADAGEVAAKFAEATKAPVKDQGAWNKSFRIAQELRKKIDAGRDPNIIAQEAAKAMGMTLGEARVAMKDQREGYGNRTASWAPAYKDLIAPRATEFVRQEKASAPPTTGLVPGLSREELLGAEELSKKDFQTSIELSEEQQAYRQKTLEAGAPISPVRAKPQTIEEIVKQNAEDRAAKESQGVPGQGAVAEAPKPKPKPEAVKPAVTQTLKESTPSAEAPKEESPRVTRVKIKKQVATEDKNTKSTTELRDEVAQVHEKINTPSPNPFVESAPKPSRVVIKRGGKGGPPDEPPPEEPDSEGAPEEDPGGAGGGKKPPGNILDGLNESRDNARVHPNLEGIANRVHTFLTEFTKRTDPGRNTYHPREQAKDVIKNKMADLDRTDHTAKEIKRLLGDNLERHRLFHPALENDTEELRQAYMKENHFSPEDTALADLLHTDWEVMGRHATSAEVELYKIAQEHYLPHMLKFDEFNKTLTDWNGNFRTFSPKIKSWLERRTDPETKQPLWKNIASLREKFGEKNVEERIDVLYQAHHEAIINLARTKEMINDLSGHYVDDLTKISPAFFEERAITGGVGGLGLKKGQARFVGRTIVPTSELKNVDAAYRDQLVPLRVGPYAVPMKNYMIYKPLASLFESLSRQDEGATLTEKGLNYASKANDVYKLYKFGFNPIHWFNVVSDVVAMMGKEGLSPTLYGKIWGRVDDHLKNPESVWKTAHGDFKYDEAVTQVVKAGGVLKKETTSAADVGGLQEVVMRTPGIGAGFRVWQNKMWYDTVWKAHIGLSMHLYDIYRKKYVQTVGREPNEAMSKNILKAATLWSKYTVGYIDKADMTRDWQTIGGAALFANKWSLAQLRSWGRVVPQNIPGAKFVANIGGGERYTQVLGDQMREAGMTQEDLTFLNSQEGHMARNLVFSGVAKLFAISTLMTVIGSMLTTQQASAPWTNFQRDPTHTFDIYTGVDPLTKKDTWQHNPLFGMQQEMMLYILAAFKAAKNGGNPYDVATAGPARYMNKLNPIGVTGLDMLINRNVNLAAQGYGDAADITGPSGDKNVAAIRQALDAHGVPDFGGLEDRLIYAIRSIAPSPGFPDNPAKNAQMTPGDISNAMGPGKILGVGDLVNAAQSGDFSKIIPQDLGNLAQYMLGTRKATSSTPDQVASNNQIAQAVTESTAKNQDMIAMVDAAQKGDWQAVNQLAQKWGLDNAQMINALEYTKGTQGGILYQGLAYQPKIAPTQDILMGQALDPAQTAQYEAMKIANSEAVVQAIRDTQEFKSADATHRASMMGAYLTVTQQAVSDQLAQQLGLLGGTPITNAQIGNLLQTAIQFHDLVGSALANNPVYQQADPITRQAMETSFGRFGISLAHDAIFGNLVGVPIGNVAEIITNTIQVEESTKSYLQGSMFYQLAAPGEQARMANEYTALARTIVKAGALGQGQGPNKNAVLSTTKDMLMLIDYTMNVEESAKSVLHGSNFYVIADPVTQKSLDTKYETLARSLAFAKSPVGDPAVIVKQSLDAEQAYYDLQNQFGGTDYLKLMAQQLTDTQANIRQSSAYTPQQITAIEKAVRAQFLAMNPAYANWLKAKLNWEKNTKIGQIYLASNASEYQAVQDMTSTAQQSVADQVLYSGTSIDPATPTSNPSQPMGLPSMGLPAL